jgi:MoaA/NifB/PqqE/SkfB family radical SAM enzyme
MNPIKYSTLRKLARLNLSTDVPLPMPLSIYIDPCSVCNYRCTFCPQNMSFNKKIFSQKMNMPMFERVISDIKEMGTLKTCNLFSFGEPLLNPLTPAFLKVAKENSIAEKYTITSNVSLLTQKTARDLVDNGLTYLRVSIYGASVSSYQKNTGTKIDLNRIIANLKYIKRYRDSVGSSLFIAVKMLDSGNGGENAAFLNKFFDLGDECFIEPMHNWNNKTENFHGGDSISICPYPFYTLVIHADFTVSVCCPDWNKQMAVGNLATTSLAQIWHGKKLYEWQYALLAQDYSSLPTCAKCSFYKINAIDDIRLTPGEFRRRVSSNKFTHISLA